jgi:hypothetical protein
VRCVAQEFAAGDQKVISLPVTVIAFYTHVWFRRKFLLHTS